MKQQACLNWIAAQQDSTLQTLQQWSSINSGSYNIDGIRTMATTASAYIEQCFQIKGELVDVTPMQVTGNNGERVEKPLGPVLKFSRRPEAPNRILFCGHMDTVFPIDSDFQTPYFIDDNTLGGPGVADMKGGILVMLNALRAFEMSENSELLGWDILLNSDEEVGSLGSAAHLKEAAKTTQLGMVFEPSMPDGWMAGARRGSGNFSLIVRGKAAHAGREYHLGRNAIAALAQTMTELDSLNSLRDSVTLNLAKLSGGGPNNIVPDLALCHFNIRVESLDDQEYAQAHVDRAVERLSHLDGFSVELHGGFNRPPKPATQQQQALFELVEKCAGTLNLDVGFRPTGGCCDGNNLLAAGLPNIDTLGVQGGNIHSDQEYMLIDSLTERAQLSYLILDTIATEPDKWLQPGA